MTLSRPVHQGKTTCAGADRVGKVTHPNAAPGNKLLLTYAKGPVNDRGTHLPLPDSGVYRVAGITNAPAEMELIVNSPQYNEFMPIAVASWQQKYGQEPVDLPWLPQGVEEHLPPGTPYGIIATGIARLAARASPASVTPRMAASILTTPGRTRASRTGSPRAVTCACSTTARSRHCA